jgi:hypothetical protein
MFVIEDEAHAEWLGEFPTMCRRVGFGTKRTVDRAQFNVQEGLLAI